MTHEQMMESARAARRDQRTEHQAVLEEAVSRAETGARRPRQAEYRPGDLILVRFGRAGSQVAVVSCDYGGYVMVRKWRDNGRKWTGTVQVDAPSLKGRADPKAPVTRRAHAALHMLEV